MKQCAKVHIAMLGENIFILLQNLKLKSSAFNLIGKFLLCLMSVTQMQEWLHQLQNSFTKPYLIINSLFFVQDVENNIRQLQLQVH